MHSDVDEKSKHSPVSGTGTDGMPCNLFDRYPRMLVTTFWGDPVAAPKSEPPNFENRAEGDDSPVLEFSSCDATVLTFFSYFFSLYNRKLFFGKFFFATFLLLFRDFDIFRYV